MVWKIRHTDDDTFLRAECMLVVMVWVAFTIIQAGTFAVNMFNACQADMH